VGYSPLGISFLTSKKNNVSSTSRLKQTTRGKGGEILGLKSVRHAETGCGKAGPGICCRGVERGHPEVLRVTSWQQLQGLERGSRVALWKNVQVRSKRNSLTLVENEMVSDENRFSTVPGLRGRGKKVSNNTSSCSLKSGANLRHKFGKGNPKTPEPQTTQGKMLTRVWQEKGIKVLKHIIEPHQEGGKRRKGRESGEIAMVHLLGGGRRLRGRLKSFMEHLHDIQSWGTGYEKHPQRSRKSGGKKLLSVSASNVANKFGRLRMVSR